jgi:NAD(P)-dependent dehydrogenase (short-subunit alcohol dehydrogenase family)
MTLRLEGKTAIVVGAGSIGPGWGNGKASAVLMAREGARVLCADLNEAAANETVEIIKSEGSEALAMRVDASNEPDVAAMVDRAKAAFGKIDILDNNVGILVGGGVAETALADWERVMAVNARSCYLTMKYVAPVMAAQGGGSIVNISSITSIRYTGVPYAGYYASKGAINSLTRATAAEYAPKLVRVNAILPGLMKTPMVEQAVALASAYGSGDVDAMWAARTSQCPMGFMGDAWDVAKAVVFLASDDARYITGIELVIDGGTTLSYANG